MTFESVIDRIIRKIEEGWSPALAASYFNITEARYRQLLKDHPRLKAAHDDHTERSIRKKKGF